MIAHVLELLLSGLVVWLMSEKALVYGYTTFSMIGLLFSVALLISTVVTSCLAPAAIFIQTRTISMDALAITFLAMATGTVAAIKSFQRIREVLDRSFLG